MASVKYDPHFTPKNALEWLDYRLPIFSALKAGLIDYRTPRNLNYWWSFGSIAGIMLVAQIVTGLFLAMHYTAHVNYAFDSVERIMRDVNYGWLIRYMHAVGASMFFAVVYIHIFRGLYYGSYKPPREMLWWLGLVILLLMMATAFMGYVLPWGQMSYWGATVITNLFSAIPLAGESIVHFLWGGFSVDNPTLNRFFALHFLLPFVIVGVVLLHLMSLHAHGSNNPTGIDVKGDQDTIPFHPYYTVKDFFGFGVFFMIYAWFIFFAPNALGHPDNYIPGNPLVTPPHIVPEWYFLPFYAILRAITFNTPLYLPGLGLIMAAGFCLLKFPCRNGVNMCRLLMVLGAAGIGALMVLGGLFGGKIEAKLGGVLAMFGAIIVLFFLPWLDTSTVRSTNYRPLYRWFFWLLLLNCIALGYLGAKPAEGIYVWLSLGCTLYYFAHFLVIMPLLSRIEKTLPLPESIGTSVLKNSEAARSGGRPLI